MNKEIQIPNSCYHIAYTEDCPDNIAVFHRNKDVTAMTKSGPASFLIRDLLQYLIQLNSDQTETEHLQTIIRQNRYLELPVPFGTGVWTYKNHKLTCIPFEMEHLSALNKTIWIKYEDAKAHGEPTCQTYP